MWCPGCDPGTEKGYKVKTKEIRVKCGFWLTIMYLDWFISCDKCTILMYKMLTIGETGHERYGNFLYYLNNFCVNLKISPQNKA